METLLNDVEVRVLGALIEKELATPDYYPLTMNSLVAACNQKSNRDPVVAFDTSAVARAIDGLRDKNMAFEVIKVDSRVPKYEHNLRKALLLSEQELAVVCVLFLRGPQTLGEIKARTGRLYPFDTLTEVQVTLETLESYDSPLTMCLPIQPGRKEPRYAHLLAGIPENQEIDVRTVSLSPTLEPDLQHRIVSLEEQVADLEAELAMLKDAFETFRNEFT